MSYLHSHKLSRSWHTEQATHTQCTSSQCHLLLEADMCRRVGMNFPQIQAYPITCVCDVEVLQLFWVFHLVNLTDTAVLQRKDMEYLGFYSKNGVGNQAMMNKWLYEVQESSYLVSENSSQVRCNSLRSTSFKNISQMITIPQSWAYRETCAKADYIQYLGM